MSSPKEHATIAEVLVARRLPRHLGAFDYAIPPGAVVCVGGRVHVMFRGRLQAGVVIRIKSTPDNPSARLLPLTADDHASVPRCTPHQMEFFSWLATETLTSPGTILLNALPPLLKRPREQRKRAVFGTTVRSNQHYLPARLPQSLFLSVTQQQQRAALVVELYEYSRTQRPVLLLCPTIDDVTRWVSLLPSKAQEHTVVMHHALTKSAQAAAYEAVLSGKARMIVGTRRALLLPFQQLGVVAVDMEEDSVHDQSEQNPRFQLLPVAQHLARITKAKFISWGFSPRLTTYHELGAGKRTHQSLASPRTARVEMYDRRDPGMRFVERIPETLITSLTSCAPLESVVVVAPHSGQANGSRCDACGNVVRCVQCHVPLPTDTRSSAQRQRCRWCGVEQDVPIQCPQCGSASLRDLRLGSEGWQQRLQKLLPNRSWKPIREGGPSMIGTLGELRSLPDTFEHAVIPDFEGLIARPDAGATEEVFHRLWEILRRTTKTVSIVARDTTHPILRSLEMNRPHTFYASELHERKQFHYPPFARLVVIRLADVTQAAALAHAEKLSQTLRQLPWQQRPRAISPAYPGFAPLPKQRFAAYLTMRFDLPVATQDWALLRKELPVDVVVSVDPLHLE